MTKKFLIITGILSLAGLLFQGFLDGWSALVPAVFQALILWLLLSTIMLLWHRERSHFRVSLMRNTLIFLSISWFFGLLITLIAAFSNTFPTPLSRITLWDGKDHEIVFIEMSHIATPRYYDEVARDLRALSLSGYTLYVEWVRPGTEENTAKFASLLGIKLDSTTYRRVAKMFWLKEQNKDIFAHVGTWSVKNVDLSLDEIVMRIGTGISVLPKTPIDIATELEGLSLENNRFFHFLMRWMLNLSLRFASWNPESLESFLDPTLANAILADRNKHIVDTYISTWEQRAVFLYGALHFDGIYSLLRAHDPSWNIVEFSPLFPYRP